MFPVLFVVAVLIAGGCAFFAVMYRNQLTELTIELQQSRGQLSAANLRHDEAVGRYNGLVTKYSDDVGRLKKTATDQREELSRLEKWKNLADAEVQAARMTRIAHETLNKAKEEAAALTESTQQSVRALLADAQSKATKQLADADASSKAQLADAQARASAQLSEASSTAAGAVSEAKQKAKTLLEDSQKSFDKATVQAARIVEEAEKNAAEVAGGAYEALKNSALYEKSVRAMKNVIEGYGDEYLIPPHSLLDDVADSLQHAQAGQELRNAREQTKVMIRNGTAAACDYAEHARRETATHFVVDAFNGRVDSILSRARNDNAGKLKQEISDAFALVNLGGKAFRNARITEQFLSSRLNELKWAAIAQQLLMEQREEQRQIKEQAREEAQAAKERERALREAAKDEETYRKAMAQAQEQFEKATGEQRAKYEERLREVTDLLKQAEERRQRALSMAQQTKKGHVYIISNIGSFGEDVFKVGLTRRWDPLERVRELGDASVPFEFDVHAMILADDAPALEKELHRRFVLTQVNKVNRRREFFRISLKEIRRAIEELAITGVTWTMVAAAKQYRDTLATEKAIAADPKVRDDFIKHQFELERFASAGVGLVDGEPDDI
jgi:cell division septum initiation protein DivIVA